ncbi:MAG: EF-hand domain-containing protein [Candidatus Thalassarchaeaceae archaeon]|nr:EF-hand domain-containing protein [Candidatus Thalassarchaeaceae archaeon]
MITGWEAQVDAMADTIEEMVRSGKGDVSEYRDTANQTIMNVGSSLPENVRNVLQDRLNSRLDALEAEIHSRIDDMASTASEVAENALDGAMMQFLQTMKGLPTDELTNLFSFIDRDGDGTINQEEFQQFVSTTMPPGTVIPPASIALGFQILDADRNGALSLADLLGDEGDAITTAAKIVAKEISKEPEPTPIPELDEEPVDSGAILDSETITSKLSEARFTSEKNKIIESIKGNLIEFDVEVTRIRTGAGQHKPMEVEVTAKDGSDYILSIDSSNVQNIPNAIEKQKGNVHISGSVLGFNMARNCVILDITDME